MPSVLCARHLLAAAACFLPCHTVHSVSSRDTDVTLDQRRHLIISALDSTRYLLLWSTAAVTSVIARRKWSTYASASPAQPSRQRSYRISPYLTASQPLWDVSYTSFDAQKNDSYSWQERVAAYRTRRRQAANPKVLMIGRSQRKLSHSTATQFR